jgi:chemotaxis methyl-accepting protein methylase
MITEFQEKLKPGGLLIIGENEEIISNDLKRLKSANITAYRKAV